MTRTASTLAARDPAPAAGPSGDLPAGDLPAEERIEQLRQEIDSCDAAIVELVRRRLAVSQEIGALRRATGGTRLSLAREREVLSRFEAALGRDGAALGMMLLRQGRGRL